MELKNMINFLICLFWLSMNAFIKFKLIAQKDRRRNKNDKVDKVDGTEEEKVLIENGSSDKFDISKFNLINPLNE